ncbi:MAG TPA: lysine--tRNA ligase [Gemmatimonadota bacterium]
MPEPESETSAARALAAESDQVAARLAKLETLRGLGIDPWPPEAPEAEAAAELAARFPEWEGSVRAVRGRVVSFRSHGRTAFLHVEDSGGRFQVYLKSDELPEEAWTLAGALDLGDFVWARGSLFRTRTGEPTLRAAELRLLAKALRPLPFPKEERVAGRRVVHGGVADRELRYRRRYVDLAVHPEVRETFRVRARVISALRRFLDARGFLEVETPVLQPLYGGAAARPFTTRHETLDATLYLRIADELYLKRLLVGGYERVYEIAKDFRNEGIDRTHYPEFTMLEFYQAYADYRDVMELAETMIADVVRETTGGSTLTYRGESADVTPPWPRLRFLDALRSRTGEAFDVLEREPVAAAAARLGVEADPGAGVGRLLDAVFKERVEPHLRGPVFVTDHPVELSPLAKRHRDDPRLTERFESFLFGLEFGNAFTELNDPLDQRRRFEMQRELRAAGDPEAHALDEDFLRALEYGMPPTGGMGIGVDRLVMFVADQPSLRDVILFPQLRPGPGSGPAAAGGAGGGSAPDGTNAPGADAAARDGA